MNISEQLSKLDYNKPEEVVNFYESNRDYFENRKNTQEKLIEHIDIKLHYVNSLFAKSYLNKISEELNDASTLLNKVSNENQYFRKTEHYIRFSKGRLFAMQERYRESYMIFKRLLQEDPDHYYYKQWYNKAKLGTLSWLINAFCIIIFIIGICDFIFSLSDNLPFKINFVCLILFLIMYIIEKRILKNGLNKNSHQTKSRFKIW